MRATKVTHHPIDLFFERRDRSVNNNIRDSAQLTNIRFCGACEKVGVLLGFLDPAPFERVSAFEHRPRSGQMNMENAEPDRCSYGINLLRNEDGIDNNSVGLTFRS